MSNALPNEQPLDDGASTAGPDAVETQALLQALGSSIALLPQEITDGEAPPEGSIAIPVIEQDGTRYVPVFTSEEALIAAGADPAPAVQLPLAELAASWPSQELWLAINPGSEDGVTLPPEGVQALATFAQA
ncbi:MAG: SseB family protein [Marmoricola sp.]